MSKMKRVSSERLSGIYKITNILNNKVYIDSSNDIYGRWLQHRNKLNENKHRNRYLQFAWNKYGEENFAFEIIELCNESELFVNEQKWYDHYNSGDDRYGYNLSKIARCPSYRATFETLKNGEQTITYEQFLKIVDMLENTDISIPKIAKELDAPERTIYQIYFKEQYTELTKNKKFVRRKKNSNTILTEKQVLEIIERLKNDDFNSDIAKDYNVSAGTIDDIRQYKTWNYLTNNITFNSIKGRKRNVGKEIDLFDLFGNFIVTVKNARVAESEYGIPYRNVSQVCNGQKRQSHGYVCRFHGDSFDKYNVLRKDGKQAAFR